MTDTNKKEIEYEDIMRSARKEAYLSIAKRGKKIPKLNASDKEWRKHWNSCRINDIFYAMNELLKKHQELSNEFKLVIRRMEESEQALYRSIEMQNLKSLKLIKEYEESKRKK